MSSNPPLYFLILFLAVSTGTALAAPAPATNVKAYAPNQSRVHLAWVDNATDETAYYIDRWNPTTMVWDEIGAVLKNAEVFRHSAPSTAEQEVKYRVAPFKPGEIIPESNWVEATVQKPQGPLDLYLNPVGPVEVPEGWEARAGVPFTKQIEVYNGAPESFTASGLDLIPGSVTLNSSTGEISGTVTTAGVYRFYIGITFGTTKTFEQIRFLRVLPGASFPVVANPGFSLPVQNVGVQGFLDISTIFADPIRPKGAWFDTSAGSFIVALFDTATPKTVVNFLGYANRRDYNATYLHRANPGFVIQGGGAGPASNTATPTQWTNVSKQVAVPNEAGISNKRGTIAMAKSVGNPDSATSEWFISVGNGNPAILDRQNGGFTAFGAVVGSSGMSVVDTINTLQRKDYSSIISGTSGVLLSEVPVHDLIAPSIPTVDSLVRVYSVFEVPPVTLQLLTNTNPSVLTATVTGMLLYLESKGPLGTASLTLRATNLDGNSVNFTLPVTIDDTEGPGVELTSLRGSRPLGSLIVKGRAADNVGLGKWRYRVNRGKWTNGKTMSGKSAVIVQKMKGFKSGKNLIEIEVFDAKGNSSGILKQRFKLG